MATTVAADVTALLARERRLRVVSDEIVAPYAASKLTVEEIGRELNVQAAAACVVDADDARLDVVVDVIDVLREAAVSHQRYLACVSELAALEAEIVHVIGQHCPIARALPTAGAIAEVRAARDALCALRVRAHRLLREGDIAVAEETLRAAIDLDPASPATHRQLGDLLLATGRRTEAARHHRLVADWMPLDEDAQIAGTFEQYFGPQPLDAAPRLRDLATDFANAGDWLVRSLVAGGDVLRAREAAASAFGRALVAAFAGEASDPADLRAYERALMFAAAGQTDRAIESLEETDGSDDAMFVLVEPLFASLRSHARFERFSRRFTPNLPPA